MNIANINGVNGETIAAKFLVKKGYDIVALNYRCRYSEVDIIAEKDEYIVFAEVKTRSENAMIMPSEAVTKQKQKKIISAASLYLSASKTEKQPRFDVIEVFLPKNPFKKSKVKHIENAFCKEGYI